MWHPHFEVRLSHWNAIKWYLGKKSVKFVEKKTPFSVVLNYQCISWFWKPWIQKRSLGKKNRKFVEKKTRFFFSFWLCCIISAFCGFGNIELRKELTLNCTNRQTASLQASPYSSSLFISIFAWLYWHDSAVGRGNLTNQTSMKLWNLQNIL